MSDLSFRLTITLGNDAMRTPADLSQALRRIANDVDNPREMAPFGYTDADGNLEPGYFQTVFDVKGNDVGRYAVKATE